MVMLAVGMLVGQCCKGWGWWETSLTGVDWAALLCDVCMELSLCGAGATGGGTTTLMDVVA